MAVFNTRRDIARRYPAMDALAFKKADDTKSGIAIGAGIADKDIGHCAPRWAIEVKFSLAEPKEKATGMRAFCSSTGSGR